MRRTVAAALLLLCAACDDSQPCASCPRLEGRYEMTYEALSTGNSCAAMGIGEPPNRLELSRLGATVRTAAQGLELSGTIYDNFAFTLAGNGPADGGQDSVQIRGTYIPGSADAGERIRGTWTGTHLRASGTCALERRYVGQKQ